ncbi:MAG: hypothetical protein K6L76_13565 [Agarilytica sp.]
MKNLRDLENNIYSIHSWIKVCFLSFAIDAVLLIAILIGSIFDYMLQELQVVPDGVAVFALLGLTVSLYKKYLSSELTEIKIWKAISAYICVFIVLVIDVQIIE